MLICLCCHCFQYSLVVGGGGAGEVVCLKGFRGGVVSGWLKPSRRPFRLQLDSSVEALQIFVVNSSVEALQYLYRKLVQSLKMFLG